MAFRISKKPTFSAVAEVFTPNDRKGHDRSTLTVWFHRTETAELDDLRKMTQVEVLRKKVAGWDDFQDEEGNVLEFTPENLELMLRIPEAVYGVSITFWESVVKGRSKN